MDSETCKKIEDTVLEILKNSNLDEVTEFKIRQSASERLEMDLSEPNRKKIVRKVVEQYLKELQEQAEEDEEGEEQKEDDSDKRGGDREFDNEGGLIICRLSKKRRVTISEFKGKTLVSIREYYSKGDQELPSTKGVSLTTQQWACFKKNVPAIEQAIQKLQST